VMIVCHKREKNPFLSGKNERYSKLGPKVDRLACCANAT
jgi:hypothetical protein